MLGPEATERLTTQIEELKRRAHQIGVDITHYCGKESESIGRRARSAPPSFDSNGH